MGRKTHLRLPHKVLRSWTKERANTEGRRAGKGRSRGKVGVDASSRRTHTQGRRTLVDIVGISPERWYVNAHRTMSRELLLDTSRKTMVKMVFIISQRCRRASSDDVCVCGDDRWAEAEAWCRRRVEKARREGGGKQLKARLKGRKRSAYDRDDGSRQGVECEGLECLELKGNVGDGEERR